MQAVDGPLDIKMQIENQQYDVLLIPINPVVKELTPVQPERTTDEVDT